MCKTRSKDSAARTACDAAAESSDDQRQQPSATGCGTALPVVAASDDSTMQRILSRDQRTTYHRLSVCNPSGGNARNGMPQQAAASARGSTLPPEIFDLISESSAAVAPRGDRQPQQQQHCAAASSNTQHSADSDTTGSANNRQRRHALVSSDLDVERQLQLQLQRTCRVPASNCDYCCEAGEDGDAAVVVLARDDHCHRPAAAIQRNKSFILLVAWFRLVGLLVALSASLVSVESAPTAMTLESRRLDQAPKWLNPCGFAAEEFEGDLDVVQLNDATLLGNIVMQAKTALNYANGFRDDFIKKTFKTDFADLHLAWKDNHYTWLPDLKQIPKKLGENLDEDYVDKLEVRMLDTALLDAYEYMQRYAVGLEQITWDQGDYDGDFRKQFKDTENTLRSVLCELQMALAERGVTPRADMTREVMSMEYRELRDATHRNLRDWLIFRDYMNGLEYVVQVFEHFIRCVES